MKKWLIKIACLFVPVWLVVIGINYFVDPANIFHTSVTDRISDGLKEQEAVEVMGDFDEGKLLEKRISLLDHTPSTIIIGSSHVLYVDWDFEDYFNAGMSGEFLDDYYASVGLLEHYGRLPETIVLCVDPYIFMEGLSIRQDSLQSYAEEEKALVKGESYKESLFSSASMERLKEVFSFSYFQSSVSALVNGVDTAMVNPTDDTGVGTYTKILKNGKRVPAESADVETQQNDWDAEWYVSSGTIYCMTDYQSLSEANKLSFELLIDHLREEGVQVEIYLPSWYETYYDEFSSNVLFAGVEASEEYIRSMAKERGITVHGSYNPYQAGAAKDDYLDSFHLNPEAARRNYEFILTE